MVEPIIVVTVIVAVCSVLASGFAFASMCYADDADTWSNVEQHR